MKKLKIISFTHIFLILAFLVNCAGSETASEESATGVAFTIFNASAVNDTLKSFDAENNTETYSATLITDPYSMHVDADAIWLGLSDGSIAKIDKTDGETILDTVTGFGITTPVFIQSNETDVYVADDDGNSGEPAVFQISKETAEVTAGLFLGAGSDSYDGLLLTSDALYVLIANDFQINKYTLADGSIDSLALGAHSDTTDEGSLESLYGYGSMTIDGDDLWIWNDYVSKLVKIDLTDFTVSNLYPMDDFLESSLELVGAFDDDLIFFDETENLIYRISMGTQAITQTYTPADDIFGDPEDIDQVIFKNNTLFVNVDDVNGTLVLVDPADFSVLQRVDAVYADVFDVEAK